MRGRKPKITGEVEQQVLVLHKEGKNDKEIAAEIGTCAITVGSYRRRKGLACHSGPSKRLDATKHEERLKMVSDGKSDTEIAKACGTTPATITMWRKKNSIVGNYGPGKKKLTDDDKRMKGYDLGLPDAEIAKQLGTNRGAIRKWRKRKGLAVVQAVAQA